MTPTHLLLTHHHADHVAENHVYKERFGVEILAHPLEAEQLLDVDRTIEPGDVCSRRAACAIGALHTPGHTAGMLNFVVDGTDVFTGDTLFKGSVGGVQRAGLDQRSRTSRPRHGPADEAPARDARCTPATPTPPRSATSGRTTPSSASGAAWTGSPTRRCTVWERRATLVLWAPDYDGGHKAWIRWDESGEDDIVPGSQVVRGG